MRIGIVDADLLYRKKHRFPNLACEKMSAYWKDKGADVSLLTNISNVSEYDRVLISKVFTDTVFPELILSSENVEYGGTGFFFDKAKNLPPEIEHHMPDYTLYDQWLEEEEVKERAYKEKHGREFKEDAFHKQFSEYIDYSLGFLTRGCFRKCEFCVNKKYNHVFAHSPLEEFYDDSKAKLCFLDDNFMGYHYWKPLLEEVVSLNKPYKFKQGLDERLLDEERCDILFNSKYDGDFTFAFDNIQDYERIDGKLQLIRQYRVKNPIKFYVLVGFESTDAEDIADCFARLELLMSYHCLPYLMRYQSETGAPWKNSKYSKLYIALARWCNQPSLFKKMSFRQFCEANQRLHKSEDSLCSAMEAMVNFEKENPEIARQYFDKRYEEYI